MIGYIYMVKLVFCAGLVYVYYLLALRNTGSHQYNRYYILFSSLLAIVLPLLSIKLDILTYDANDSLVKSLQAATIGEWEKEIIVYPGSTFSDRLNIAGNILILIYLAGMLYFLIPVIKSLYFIRRLCKTCEHDRIEGYRFYQTSEPAAPFSFFNVIFWNRDIALTSKDGQYILRHEIFHIQGKHSADLAWMQCLSILFWFNPFFHLMKSELQTIHEFLADEHALADNDKFAYAELLVLRAIRQQQFTLSNHFFHNQIRRRIAMITKTKLYRFNYLGKAMALAVLFIIFCAFSFKIKQHSTSKILENLIGNDTLPAKKPPTIKYIEVRTTDLNGNVVAVGKLENGDSVVITAKNLNIHMPNADRELLAAEGKVITQADVDPEYPGSAAGWIAYLNKTFRYPPEAITKKAEGTVLVQFLIDQDGNVSDVQAIKGPETGGLKEEAMRVIRESGKWVPAKQYGVAVKAYKIQPITFKLKPE